MTPNGNGRLPFQPRPRPAARVALPRITDPALAATMLEEAQQALFKLVTGQLPSAVDTPQLGRVAFQTTNPTDLQMLIDYLQGVVAGGTNGAGAGSNVRKPFSFYAWP